MIFYFEWNCKSSFTHPHVFVWVYFFLRQFVQYKSMESKTNQHWLNPTDKNILQRKSCRFGKTRGCCWQNHFRVNYPAWPTIKPLVCQWTLFQTSYLKWCKWKRATIHSMQHTICSKGDVQDHVFVDWTYWIQCNFQPIKALLMSASVHQP